MAASPGSGSDDVRLTARFGSFLQSTFERVRVEFGKVTVGFEKVSDGVRQVIRAVSPARKRPRPFRSSFGQDTASRPSFEDQLAERISSLPPVQDEPAAKRQRTSLPPTPIVTTRAASSPASSPFAGSAPPHFGPLQPEEPFTPSIYAARDPRPRNAQGLRPVLRTPASSLTPRSLRLSRSDGRMSTFFDVPTGQSLDVAVFKYPAAPRRRYRSSSNALQPLTATRFGSSTARELATRRNETPRRRSSGLEHNHTQGWWPTPQTELLSTDDRRASLPVSVQPSLARPLPLSNSVRNRAPLQPLSARPPACKKTLAKPQKRKPRIIQGVVARHADKVRVQKAAAVGFNLSTSPHLPNGTVHTDQQREEEEIVVVTGTDVRKEQLNNDHRAMREIFPELVELMDQNPWLGKKLAKIHGARAVDMAKAALRTRERKHAIKESEECQIRLRAKSEVGKGGLQKWVQRYMKNSNEPEEPPLGADYLDEMYWSDEGEEWYEEDDEEAMEERERKVTVTSEESAYAPLTRSALKRLRRTMVVTECSDADLARINGCIITGRDLARLRPGVWLNDEIVNAYLEMLGMRNTEKLAGDNKENVGTGGSSESGIPKVRIMNSFFYAKLVTFNRAKGYSVYDYSRIRRWTRRFDAFSYDMMLIPINQQNTHWTLGVVNFKEKTVQHLDSMGTGGSTKVRENLMAWVRDEAADKKKEFDQSEWTMPRCEVPRQENSDDCGVFLCKFADFLARGWTKFTFSQQHMNYFRSRIAHELLLGRAA